MAESVIDMTSGVYRRLYAAATRGRRINSISIEAEFFFWRLHCVADDFGCFNADPECVQMDAVPRRKEVTLEQIRRWTEELESSKLIVTYNVKNDLYGRILDFLKFQPAGKNGRRIQRYPDESGGIRGNPGESGGIPCIQNIPGDEKKKKPPIPKPTPIPIPIPKPIPIPTPTMDGGIAGRERGNGRVGASLEELNQERHRIEDMDPEAFRAFPGTVAAKLCAFLGVSQRCAAPLSVRSDIGPERIYREWSDIISNEALKDKPAVLASRLGLTKRKGRQ